MIGGADIGQSVRADGAVTPSAGILPRAVIELFRLLEERSALVSYSVEVQMLQLYKDKLEDLLIGHGRRKGTHSGSNLRIVLADHSSSGLVEVDGVGTVSVDSAADVLRLIAAGSSRRSTASTQM
eukprot:CAMPEP_0182429340 /NCGR_PEP_ID=MMETSP1167-20130531/26463_1 /TAXON_ID=2988 /ORGANISM="Mallomonas Sp, Strain CCMP3275" /LENGTH=124 /DNA_ID=CAMNT_0024612839 /DNA_START=34 /DNA_END=405 /DNA_ORIENTATION=+